MAAWRPACHLPFRCGVLSMMRAYTYMYHSEMVGWCPQVKAPKHNRLSTRLTGFGRRGNQLKRNATQLSRRERVSFRELRLVDTHIAQSSFAVWGIGKKAPGNAASALCRESRRSQSRSEVGVFCTSWKSRLRDARTTML